MVQFGHLQKVIDTAAFRAMIVPSWLWVTRYGSCWKTMPRLSSLGESENAFHIIWMSPGGRKKPSVATFVPDNRGARRVVDKGEDEVAQVGHFSDGLFPAKTFLAG
jgi:hypothetical protein